MTKRDLIEEMVKRFPRFSRRDAEVMVNAVFDEHSARPLYLGRSRPHAVWGLTGVTHMTSTMYRRISARPKNSP